VRDAKSLVGGRISRACLEHVWVLLHAVGSARCYPGAAHRPAYRLDLCRESADDSRGGLFQKLNRFRCHGVIFTRPEPAPRAERN